MYKRKACAWQTIKNADPMLGIELLDAMWAEYQYRYACSAGLSKKSVKMCIRDRPITVQQQVIIKTWQIPINREILTFLMKQNKKNKKVYKKG